MISADAFLASLAEAAAAAGAREDAFKAEAAATLKRLETERADAYRRLNFLKILTGLAATAETPEASLAALRAHVCATFGWDSETEARTQVLERLVPVSAALFAATHPAPDNTGEDASGRPQDTIEIPSTAQRDPAAALTDFEAWYEQTRASSFWYLFEHYMPETPRVDF